MALPDDTISGGRYFIAGFEGTTPSEEIVTLIQKHGLAGVILYGKNCLSAEGVAELTQSLRDAAGAVPRVDPLLIAVDQEQGAVVRIRDGVTVFPPMSTLAQLGDGDLVRTVARAVSRELLALGVNWNLAPVADVPLSGDCPVAERSFGSDASAASALVQASVEGAEEAGIASCLKHFPGHGGVCEDSHVAAPVDGRPAGEILARDLQPFRAGIAAGAPAVMTAHVTFPDLGGEGPATFSQAIIGGLLRRDLGFRGVVVSDDLEMAGAAGRYGLAEASVRALAAGVDLLIVSGMILRERTLPGLCAEMGERIAAGEVPEERLRDADRRIAGMKNRYLDTSGSARRTAGTDVLRCPAHLDLLSRIRERLGE
jgi:beta-N-acetylhexosaminidase